MHVNISNLLRRAFCDLNVIPNVLPLKLFELITQNPPKMFLFFTSLIVKSECSSVYCLNGGTCRDEPTGYHCDCQFGFYGKRCEGRLKKQASHRTYL